MKVRTRGVMYKLYNVGQHQHWCRGARNSRRFFCILHSFILLTGSRSHFRCVNKAHFEFIFKKGEKRSSSLWIKRQKRTNECSVLSFTVRFIFSRLQKDLVFIPLFPFFVCIAPRSSSARNQLSSSSVYSQSALILPSFDLIITIMIKQSNVRTSENPQIHLTN